MCQVQTVTLVTWVTWITLTHTCPKDKFLSWPNWVQTYIIRSVLTMETHWCQNYCPNLIRKSYSRQTILLKKCVFLPTLMTCVASKLLTSVEI